MTSNRKIYEEKIRPIVEMLNEMCTEHRIPVCVAVAFTEANGEQVAIQRDNAEEVATELTKDAMMELIRRG